MKTKDELAAREKALLDEARALDSKRDALMKEHRAIVEQRYALQKEESAQSVQAGNAANAKISAMLRNDRMRRMQAVFADLGGADPTAVKKPAVKKEKAE